jgi:hypothetical protein
MTEPLLQVVCWVGVALAIIFFMVDMSILVMRWVGQ